MAQTATTGEGDYFIDGDYLKAIRDFALTKGINPSELTEGSGLSLSALLNPPARIGDHSMQAVGRNLVSRLENPMVASVEYARHMANNYHGLLGIAAMESMTLEDASELLAQFLAVRSSLNRMEVIKGRNEMKLRLVPVAIPPEGLDAMLFFPFAILVNLEMLGRDFLKHHSITGTSRINMPQPEPENFPHHLLEEQIKVYFNQEHFELCVPIEWTRLPLGKANPELVREARSILESELMKLSPDDLASVVRQIIREAENTIPTLHKVAAELHMSPSTLQRRLRERGVTFRELKETELLDRAQTLLADPALSMEAISEQLGFNNPSNFTKAFKTWTGMTPRQYRQQIP